MCVRCARACRGQSWRRLHSLRTTAAHSPSTAALALRTHAQTFSFPTPIPLCSQTVRRRVNALEFLVLPRLEATIRYIVSEMDEQVGRRVCVLGRWGAAVM